MSHWSAAGVALFCASLAGCAYSREGWGRGRYFVVAESPALQVRRSSVRIDAATGDLVMNWIGARAPAGAPPIAAFSVTVFDDADGDDVPDASEVRLQRESSETSPKLLFSDVRVPERAVRPELRVRVQTSSAAGAVESHAFPFRPDP